MRSFVEWMSSVSRSMPKPTCVRRPMAYAVETPIPLVFTCTLVGVNSAGAGTSPPAKSMYWPAAFSTISRYWSSTVSSRKRRWAPQRRWWSK